MRAPRYNVAIRGDARTIKALFARGSQLTRRRGGEKRRRACPRFDVTRRVIQPTGNGNEDESKPFR